MKVPNSQLKDKKKNIIIKQLVLNVNSSFGKSCLLNQD